MKNWIKSSISSILLICVTLVVLCIAYIGFIAGPLRAYEREDRYAVEAMMNAKGYKKAELLNRFSYDNIYYITRVNHKSEKFIVWFKSDLSKIVKHDDVSYEPMKAILNELKLTDDSLSLGVYHNELVYVVKGVGFEKFYDLNTLEVIFEIGGQN